MEIVMNVKLLGVTAWDSMNQTKQTAVLNVEMLQLKVTQGLHNVFFLS